MAPGLTVVNPGIRAGGPSETPETVLQRNTARLQPVEGGGRPTGGPYNAGSLRISTVGATP
jgi:hypothetical protein